jgi:uncharacterized protein YjbJ (UPF0337 family)
MDRGRVKGTIDEVVGNAKRHLGNLTGNTRTEVEGAAQQIKGKIENAVGKLKDSVRDARASQALNAETPPEEHEVVVLVDRKTD